jgi:hypothetical protein
MGGWFKQNVRDNALAECYDPLPYCDVSWDGREVDLSS